MNNVWKFHNPAPQKPTHASNLSASFLPFSLGYLTKRDTFSATYKWVISGNAFTDIENLTVQSQNLELSLPRGVKSVPQSERVGQSRALLFGLFWSDLHFMSPLHVNMASSASQVWGLVEHFSVCVWISGLNRVYAPKTVWFEMTVACGCLLVQAHAGCGLHELCIPIKTERPVWTVYSDFLETRADRWAVVYLMWSAVIACNGASLPGASGLRKMLRFLQPSSRPADRNHTASNRRCQKQQKPRGNQEKK